MLSDSNQAWDEIVDYSTSHGLLALPLYLIHSVPENGLLPVLEARADHVLYQHTLEERGILFGAGPLADESEQSWDGEGLFIYRAAGVGDAVSIAGADPMHVCGARRFRVRPWLLNEGSLSLRVVYSSGRVDVPRVRP